MNTETGDVEESPRNVLTLDRARTSTFEAATTRTSTFKTRFRPRGTRRPKPRNRPPRARLISPICREERAASPLQTHATTLARIVNEPFSWPNSYDLEELRYRAAVSCCTGLPCNAVVRSGSQELFPVQLA